MSNFKPSIYQQRIEDWVLTGRGHAAISAVAGSGKTTTLVNTVAPVLTGKSLFVAFNKSIASELGERLEGTQVQSSTIHSAGFSAIRATHNAVMVKNDKYRKILNQLITEGQRRGTFCGECLTPGQEAALWSDVSLYSVAARIIDLARLTLSPIGTHVVSDDFMSDADWSAISSMACHYSIDLCYEHEDWLRLAIPYVLREGLSMSRAVVDFTDMLWVPVVDQNVRRNLTRYDWLLVDECQDLNDCQLSLVRSMLRPGGRMLAVGDPNQAIYGFAGADSSSFDNIVEAMDAEVLPLSICYRCPASVVELAGEIVPQIEAAKDARQGIVKDISYDSLTSLVQEGDMVICRTTKPIVKLAFELIREGIPATVKGRSIGKGLERLLGRIARAYKRDVGSELAFADVGGAIESYLDMQLGKMIDKGASDVEMAAMGDTCATLTCIWERCEGTRLDDVVRAIDSLFSDDRGSVTLSTIHRAKGLEGERVFILRPDLLPHPMAKQDWEREQEMNLKYVAITRAMEALYFVNGQ